MLARLGCAKCKRELRTWICCAESGIRNPESGVRSPESPKFKNGFERGQLQRSGISGCSLFIWAGVLGYQFLGGQWGGPVSLN